MKEYLKIGQPVYFAPQAPVPAATEENPNPVAPTRPTGIVRGIQDLEAPVSYLVVKDDGGNEWIAEDNLEVIAEEEGDAEKTAA